MKFQEIRGMKDILPDETPFWQWIEAKMRDITRRYNYHEIRPPILEPVALFKRAVGESTDIVSKEMYDFLDKGGDHITLRPEATSSTVRSVLQNNLCYSAPQRLWYLGPMFRYERPQKGRLRQFTQFGVETFGMADANIDAELICMTRDFFDSLGVLSALRLEINSLGTSDERKEHRQAIISYFSEHKSLLDEDSLKRLEVNPLRILDSKNPAMQKMINSAPRLIDFLQGESLHHFAELKKLLEHSNIPYTVNPRLVRGLDYYSRTVFEWITDSLGTQGTVCGGGRYDGLVSMLSNKSIPASGFAMGVERLLLLVETVTQQTIFPPSPDVVVTYEKEEQNGDALIVANQIRSEFTTLTLLNDFSNNKLKKQHTNALKLKARLIVTLNSDQSIGLWDTLSNQRITANKNDFIRQLHLLLTSS